MSFRVIAIAILAFMAYSGFAQSKTTPVSNNSKSFNVKWGPEVEERNTLDRFLGYDKSGNVYLLKHQAKGFVYYQYTYYIEKYDSKFNFKAEFKIDLLDEVVDGKKLGKNFSKVLLLGDNLYIYSFTNDNKNKVKNLFVQTVDKTTLKPATKVNKIATIDFSGYSKFNSGDFSYEVSADSSKVLVYYNTPYETKTPEKFGLAVYDANMTNLWTKEITLPYNDEMFAVQDFILDNDGNVSIVGKRYNEKMAKEKIKGNSNVTYVLLTYSDKGEKQNKADLKLKNLFINKIKVQYDQDRGVFMSAGFYSKEAGSSTIAGLFFAEYSADGSIVTLDNEDFSAELLTMSMKARKQEKVTKKIEEGDDVEMYNYTFDYFKPIPGGGMLVTAENFYITTYTDSKGNTRTTYHYNDILAAKISDKGEIAWMTKVPKRQSGGAASPYFSYAPAVVDDKVYLIFNDHEENLGYITGPPTRTPGPGGSIVCVAQIDNTGKTKRYSLTTNRELGLNMFPEVCMQLKNGEMQLFAQKRKKQVIGTVKLN